MEDGGPGLFPAEEHVRCELFYRLPANEPAASGTGIGLFVVRQLAAAMGGDVTCRVGGAARPARGRDAPHRAGVAGPARRGRGAGVIAGSRGRVGCLHLRAGLTRSVAWLER